MRNHLTCNCVKDDKEVFCVQRVGEKESMLFIGSECHVIRQTIEDCLDNKIKEHYSDEPDNHYCLGTA